MSRLAARLAARKGNQAGNAAASKANNLARGMGQNQRGSVGFADNAAGTGNSSHIWSKGPTPSSVDNAYGHWTKHGSDFPLYQNLFLSLHLRF